jgi:hypothetical protein
MGREAARRLGTVAIGGVGAWLLYQYTMERVLKGTVSVEVVDYLSGSPIEGAEVTADGVSGTTDKEGKVSLRVGTGWRTVKASKPGYLESSKRVYVEPLKILPVKIELGPDLPAPSQSGTVNVRISVTADQLWGNDSYSEAYALSPAVLKAYTLWHSPRGDLLMELYRPWVEEGRYIPSAPTPHWPEVPPTLRRYVKSKLPLENLTVRLYNPAWEKRGATLADGTVVFYNVPKGEYVLSVDFDQSRDLPYWLGGTRAPGQLIVVDEDHTEFRIHLDQAELFPRRTASLYFEPGTADYFIRLVEQPVPGGVNWVLVRHRDPSLIYPLPGAEIFLDIWEADKPDVTSVESSDVKFRYAVHIVKAVEERVGGVTVWRAVCSCGWQSADIDLKENIIPEAIGHYISTGMPSGTAFMVYPIDVCLAPSYEALPTHVLGMLVLKGVGRYLYVKFSRPATNHWSLLRAEIAVPAKIGGSVVLLAPPRGYHPFTERTAGGAKIWIACPECGFKTSEKLAEPLDLTNSLEAKKAAWDEFVSADHLSKHLGEEFEGPEARLRQVLLWGYGYLGFSPSLGLVASSCLTSPVQAFACSPSISASSSLAPGTLSQSYSPSISASSDLTCATVVESYSPSISASSSLSSA